MKKMTQRIAGGLGNQLFEYAFAYSLAKEQDAELVLDLSNYTEGAFRDLGLDYFKLDSYDSFRLKLGNSFLNKLYRRFRIGMSTKVLNEYDISPEMDWRSMNNVYLTGVFASHKYFEKYEDDIRRQYQLNIKLSEEARSRISDIKTKKNSVAVHIRRGDYVSVNRSTLSMEYFENAMKKMEKLLGSCEFVFFCEDITWVQNWFGDKGNYTYMNPGVTDIEEFYIMQQCENIITADSTFSWWAAWLNRNDKKTVIVPRSGNQDYYPNDWIQLEAKAVNVDEHKEYA